MIVAAGLMAGSMAVGQTPPDKKKGAVSAPSVPPANQLAEDMAKRLSNNLHIKTVVGDPVKIGTVTLIPILMMDVSFGGGGIAPPASPGAPAQAQPEGQSGAFFMNGEARPLGFVAITPKGVRFISVGKTPAH